MSWSSWAIPFAGLDKKICRYLLQRYLGKFLEVKLNLEQLSVDLYNGKGTVKDVALNCEALNEVCESQGWGVEVTGGHVGSVTITVPWTSPMSEDSYVEVSDLCITIRPLSRQTDGTPMFESMWSSMSSSMQLAQECLEKADDDGQLNEQNAIEGLEKFAQTIDSVLNRVKAKLLNTQIRLEYVPNNSDHGIAIIIKVKELDYQNEAGNDPLDSPSDSSKEQNDGQKTHLISTYATHHIKLNGITFYTEEFRIANENDESSTVDATTSSFFSNQQFYSIISQLPVEPEDSNNDIINESFSSNTTETDNKFDNEDKEHSDEEEQDLTINTNRTDAVQLAQLNGEQIIRIKMKQSETVEGPKVSLELQLGSFYFFITPRQLHLVLTFTNIFLNDQQKTCLGSSSTEKFSTMQEDQKKSSSTMSNLIDNLGGGGGWSCDPTDEYTPVTVTSSKNFPPIRPEISGLRTFEDCDSMNSSMTTSSSTTCSSKLYKKTANINELNGEISHFNVRIASVNAVLLHDDILLDSNLPHSVTLINNSISKLLGLSDKYFNSINSDKETNLKNWQCKQSHLKLYVKPIIVEGEQQRTNSYIIFKLTTSITRADFSEVLDNIATPLIYFDREAICRDGFHKRPEITIAVRTTTATKNTANNKPKKKVPTSRTKINITLESCIVELDITLYDRLNAIFGDGTLLFQPEENVNQKRTTNEQKNSTSTKQQEPLIEVEMDSTKLDLRLRFPIIDSRPLYDLNRIPWWIKNIRTDFLLFRFYQFRFKNCSTFFDICANEVDVFYCETLNTEPIQICKSCFVDCSGITTREPYVEYPRITLEFPSDKSLQTIINCTVEDSDSGETSGESCPLFTGRCSESLPFCSESVCRQNDDDSEATLLPAEKAEMKSFCDKAMKTSKMQFKVFLPVANVQIKSKLLYEIIYNRLNSDLLMWQPNAPNVTKKKDTIKLNKNRPSSKHHKQTHEEMLWNSSMMDSLYVPSSTNNDENCDDKSYLSDGPESKSESDEVFYSTYDKKRTKRSQTGTRLALSDCSFELNINRAIATLFSPVRDSENHVIPEQLGEFVFDLETFTLFSVSGFNGNDNLTYLCIQSKAAKLFHCGLIPNSDKDPILRLINSKLPNYLVPTLFPTPANFTINSAKKSEKREMISFAIEIKKVPQQRIKRIRLTAGLHNTTLKHNLATAQHTWINQIIDLFDVLDYPIEGYEPYGIVTEMQLHLWNCAIDYRPLNFPFRAVAEIGNFVLSSNIISSVSGCTLRFIVEDATLSLAPYDFKSGENTSGGEIPFVSSKNLVSVLDLGLLDISLRLNAKATENLSELDLRASIQDMHIRTCYDSGRALALLVGYIAADGDLSNTTEENINDISVSSEGSTDLLSTDDGKSLVSAKQQERVNSLMADAIQDAEPCEERSDYDESNSDKGVELYFFPDENQLLEISSLKDKKQHILPPGSPATPYDSTGVSRSSSEEWRFPTRRESESSNELRDILNFESNVMSLSSYTGDDEATEALPQIREELGEVPSKVSNKELDQKSRKSSLNFDEDFLFIGDEEKAAIPNYGIKDLKVSAEPLRIVDNHFPSPIGKPDMLKAPVGFPMAVTRYTLCEMTVTWHIFGGRDFPETDTNQKDAGNNKENILPRRTSEMSEAYRMGVSYSKGQQHVQFGKHSSIKLSTKNRGGPGRKHDVLVEMQFSKVRMSHEIYPAHTTQASRQVLIISTIEIRDRLQTSEINKFLYHPTAKHLSNKSSQDMVVIKALHIRPNPQAWATQECSLRVSLLPLRLNIDQDTLLFLVQFFNDFGSSMSEDSTAENSNNKKSSMYQLQEPVMMVDDLPEAIHDLQSRKMVSTNLELLMEDDEITKEISPNEFNLNNEPPIHGGESSDVPVYFREVIFSPEVLIRLDYHGRRIEMSRGPLAGLLMGLGQLQCSEIRLKKIEHRHGLLGFDKLINFIFKEWLHDIKQNQLPKILTGVGPMNSIVQIFLAVFDLFWLPIEQYQKDGRIIRGLQLGAQSFTARTAIAALEITSRIIQLLQITAETAFDMVSPGPSVRRGRHNPKGKRKRKHRPQDIREGVANAYQIFKDGINERAYTLIENTVTEHDQKGYTGAVGAVFRQIPPLVVCPVVLATQATTNVLGGVRNQLVPDARLEAREKWKEDDSD